MFQTWIQMEITPYRSRPWQLPFPLLQHYRKKNFNPSAESCVKCSLLFSRTTSRTLKVRGRIISQADRYLGGFCSPQSIFPPQILQVLLTNYPHAGGTQPTTQPLPRFRWLREILIYNQLLKLKPYQRVPTKLDMGVFLVNTVFCFLMKCG